MYKKPFSVDTFKETHLKLVEIMKEKIKEEILSTKGAITLAVGLTVACTT